MKIIKLIKNNELFSNFEDSEVNSIFDCLNGRILKCSRGRIVYAQDDEVSEIGIVLQGNAAKFITREDGRKEVVEILGEGEMFGEIDGYNPEKKAKYSVIAAEECTILYITISTIVRQCEKNCTFHQKLLENTLQYMARRIHTMHKDAEYLKEKSMRVKIAKLIYEKYVEQDTLNVRLGINRNEMAEYLNVSRPSMSREMIRMREEGIFDFWKDHIDIKNLEALVEIVRSK